MGWLLVIAAFGAHGAAALMLYSPTKLARRLSGKGTSHKDVDDRIATLKTQSRELQVTARLLAIGGVVGAVFLTHQSVRGTLGGVALVLMALAVLFLVGTASPMTGALTITSPPATNASPSIDPSGRDDPPAPK